MPYERDVPYLLKVDFENNKITTEKKMKCHHIAFQVIQNMIQKRM